MPIETGELSLAMAFPVEGWSSSVLVVVRQGDVGRIRGEVHGPDAEAERAWRQALAVLSLDVDGSGWPAVGERDPAIGRLQAYYVSLRPSLFHSQAEDYYRAGWAMSGYGLGWAAKKSQVTWETGKT
jgi:hypothetical protein